MTDYIKPRTDPRIIRTRQLLKDAFIDLLQEMDIEKISVNRIAERATINRVTFYLHYRDIPDMLEKMADEMIEDIQRVLNESPDSGYAPEDYASMLVRLLKHIAEQAKFYKVILSSKRMPVFTERLLKLLSESIMVRIENLDAGIGSKITKSGLQREIAIWYGASALIGTIVSWLRKDMPYTPEYLAKQIMMLRSHIPTNK